MRRLSKRDPATSVALLTNGSHDTTARPARDTRR